MTDRTLPIAHRVWTEPDDDVKRPSGRKAAKSTEPTAVLFFDTETTTDRRQALTFGCWRYCQVHPDGLHCIDEGIFYADDLGESDPEGLEVLKRYVKDHPAATQRDRSIRLMPRAQFVERVFYLAAYRGRARVVGFNLPFDLSRVAVGVTEARGKNHGGLSLILSAPSPESAHRERKHRARVVIKHLDSKAAFISFGKPMNPDDDDLIPEGSKNRQPDRTYAWRGRFVDLRTLAFALSGEAYSLDGACKAFGVEGKSDSGGYGVITEQHVDYCRQDVAATVALYEALICELQRHPVSLAPERAYSPASLSKAYLAAMGIEPLLDRHPDFSPEVLGYAMAAFYGGAPSAGFAGSPFLSHWSTSLLCTRRSTLSWTSTGSRSLRRSKSTMRPNRSSICWTAWSLRTASILRCGPSWSDLPWSNPRVTSSPYGGPTTKRRGVSG